VAFSRVSIVAKQLNFEARTFWRTQKSDEAERLLSLLRIIILTILLLINSVRLSS